MTLIKTQKFDEVRLLNNYSSDFNNWYASWLPVKPRICELALAKLTDYAAIFENVSRELEPLKSTKLWATTDLCFYLSPGNPAIAATWLLLGKTRFPATFYETFEGKSWVIDVPFDLIDVITAQRKLILHVPGISDQKAFSPELSLVHEIRAKNVAAAEEADHLFASLDQRAFKGEL